MDSFGKLAGAVVDSSPRKRTAIATRACQRCRDRYEDPEARRHVAGQPRWSCAFSNVLPRKSKCDEQKPKCSLCHKLDVECSYRELLPIKKDMTIAYILHTLTSLEKKFDILAIDQSNASTSDKTTRALATRSSPGSSAQIADADSKLDHDFPSDLHRFYRHLTAPHKVFSWPRVYTYLTNSGIHAASDLQQILQEGTPWFIRHEMKKLPLTLPTDPGLPVHQLDDPSSSSSKNYPKRCAFPTIPIQQVQHYTEAYFNTFNVISPILNYDVFTNEVVKRLSRQGYADGDPESIIALLVYALGQLAIEGAFGNAISNQNGVPSGFRGGTAERPPGLEIFNEARRRLGFCMGTCTIEDVQILLLQAAYYEASSRHLDFYRCTATASTSMHALIRYTNIDWQSQSGDMIARAYWTCVLNEDLYHMDLDLPGTSVGMLEDDVPLPSFHKIQDSQGLRFQYYFLAMIALKRLITRINTAIYECISSQTPPRNVATDPATATSGQSKTSDDYGGPPARIIRELACQLDSWRSLLPQTLQWLDSDILGNPNLNPISHLRNESSSSSHQGLISTNHMDNLDIAEAQLRTRFYYARFMMFRPFIYKTLHFPDLMTADDAECCAIAIRSCCMWPLFMASPKNKKRLIPHLFSWTQNALGISLILRMTWEDRILRQICEHQVNQDDMKRTVVLMMEWMRDVKQVDGIAEWGCRILEPMFACG